MNSKTLPPKVSHAAESLEKIKQLAHQYGLSRLELALSFVRDTYPQARIIFGAEHPKQVKDNLSAWKKDVPSGLGLKIQSVFADTDTAILNPSLWN